MTGRTNAEVGEHVRARRIELKLTPTEVLTAAGIDPKTLQRLEDGSRWPIERTRRKIESALRWEPGSIDALAAGAEPTVLRAKRDPHGDQGELELYRLAYLVMDSRDLLRLQKGPLMTALDAMLSEASDLVIKRVARSRAGTTDISGNDIEAAHSLIREGRESNNIHRQGDRYVRTLPDPSPDDSRSFTATGASSWLPPEEPPAATAALT